MTAGLPGTGIGGLFYLLAALCLPLRFAWLRARGQRDHRHRVFVIRQLAMSMSMLAAVWLTGALWGFWRPLPKVLTVAPIVVTFGTLAAILIAVEIGRLIIRPPPQLRARGPQAQVRPPIPSGDAAGPPGLEDRLFDVGAEDGT
ncbi:MAG TPA: hypothetical protein VEL48_13145 [Candidatus Acidoferrales bacterium]|nr:hypothetical protein [Candidatus Acidoferrales bacterium]